MTTLTLALKDPHGA